MFTRINQQFIWGEDLRDDLIALNNHYTKLPDKIKEKGIFSFAKKPPKEPRFLVAEIWDKHLPNWRFSEDNSDINKIDHTSVIEKINKIDQAEVLLRGDIDFDLSDPDALLIKRPVRRRRGSWILIN